MSARTYSWLSLPCALALLAGCPSPEPVKVVKSPKVMSFTATPSDLASSGTVTLTWDTEDAQSVVVYDSHRGAISNAVSPDGTVQVEVDRTTLFVLTATGEEGRTASAVAQVRSGTADSELVFVAEPAVVKKGGAVTLAWAATDPRDLKLATSDGVAIDVGGQTTTGSITVYPEVNTTYVIEAAGRRAESSVQIRANIESFEVTPRGAEPGKPLTFSWKTTAASKVTLDEVDGDVLTSTTDAAQVADGSFALAIPAEVALDRVFNFRLRAEGGTSGVVAEQLLTVYVAGQTRILTVDLPRYALTGGTFTATWTTAEADQVQLLANGVVVYQSLDAQVAKAGSAVLPTPPANTTYTLRATSYRGGEATVTREVAPVGTTTVNSATATPASIAQGGEPVTLQWNIAGARHVQVIHSADGVVFTGSGEAMENQSLTVLPNSTGTYQIVADNTLGEFAVAKVAVSVSQPTTLSLSQTGTILYGENVTVSAPALAGASGFVGFTGAPLDVAPGAAAAQFVDVSSTGTRLKLTATADQSLATVHLDFETWLFAEKLGGDMVVATDGFLVFGRYASSKADNLPIPGSGFEPFLVAPFWDDLVLGPNSAVFWEVRGEAPNRTLFVQWDKVQLKGQLSSELTFQAQIHQTGQVKFAYAKLNAPGATPTVGIQGPVPDRAVAYSGTVAEGDVLTLFGEQAAPLAMDVKEAGPFNAFVKVGDAYLRVPFTFEKLLAPNQLVISEVMPAPAGSLARTGEWIEVANFSSAPVDLAGWRVDGELGSFVVTAGANQKTVVPAGGTLVLGANRDPALNGGLIVDYEYPSSFTLADTPSFVAISNGSYVAQRVWAATQAGVSEVTDPGPFLALGDPAGTTPHAATCNGTRTYGDPLLGQKGTPGVLKGCFGYHLARVPVNYYDISTTGVRLLNGGVSQLTAKVASIAGTGTTLFGIPVTSLGVSRYGYVVFNATSTTPYYSYTFADSLPNASTPNFTAALFGAALQNADALDADVYLQRLEAGEDLLNPVGHWILQWSRLRIGSGDDFNFQLKIFDDGSLEYHYGNMVSGDAQAFGRGGTAVSWLENPTGTLAQPISVKKPLIRSNTAYRFIAE